jgi:hypothetical protein
LDYKLGAFDRAPEEFLIVYVDKQRFWGMIALGEGAELQFVPTFIIPEHPYNFGVVFGNP